MALSCETVGLLRLCFGASDARSNLTHVLRCIVTAGVNDLSFIAADVCCLLLS